MPARVAPDSALPHHAIVARMTKGSHRIGVVTSRVTGLPKAGGGATSTQAPPRLMFRSRTVLGASESTVKVAGKLTSRRPKARKCDRDTMGGKLSRALVERGPKPRTDLRPRTIGQGRNLLGVWAAR